MGAELSGYIPAVYRNIQAHSPKILWMGVKNDY
jgi:hypothetical protein